MGGIEHIRNDFASFFNRKVEEIFLMWGGSEYHILDAAPENALSGFFFFLKHEGFRSRLLALLERLNPPDKVSFYDRYGGVLW